MIILYVYSRRNLILNSVNIEGLHWDDELTELDYSVELAPSIAFQLKLSEAELGWVIR